MKRGKNSRDGLARLFAVGFSYGRRDPASQEQVARHNLQRKASLRNFLSHYEA